MFGLLCTACFGSKFAIKEELGQLGSVESLLGLIEALPQTDRLHLYQILHDRYNCRIYS